MICNVDAPVPEGAKVEAAPVWWTTNEKVSNRPGMDVLS